MKMGKRRALRRWDNVVFFLTMVSPRSYRKSLVIEKIEKQTNLLHSQHIWRIPITSQVALCHVLMLISLAATLSYYISTGIFICKQRNKRLQTRKGTSITRRAGMTSTDKEKRLTARGK